MRVDINHPSFTNFIDNVISNILTNVYTDKYFTLSNEQKLADQLKVFKVMNTSLRRGVTLTELEYRSFVNILLKKSEEGEKYELAAIMKDVLVNFDNIYEVTKPIKKTTRKIKTNTKNE